MKKSNQDLRAEESGWLILKPGEAYERQLSQRSAVYILREGDKWCVWRGYWYQGKSEPQNHKVLIKNTSFENALSRGNNYINWMNNRKQE